MFNTSLFLDRELELRHRKETFLHERLWPDSTPPIPWLRRLSQWLKRRQDPMGLSPEQPEVQHDSELTLLVPDDHIALLIQDGLAMDLLEGGRHRFPSPFGRLKVVWIHQETIRNQAPEDFWSMTLEERLPLVRRLPRERVHLYVDRVLVAMIKPAWSVRTQGSTSNGRILPSVEPSLKPSARETMEDPDPVQRFSFI